MNHLDTSNSFNILQHGNNIGIKHLEMYINLNGFLSQKMSSHLESICIPTYIHTFTRVKSHRVVLHLSNCFIYWDPIYLATSEMINIS